MTNNQLTDKRLSWLHDAATELSNTNLKMTMNPEELLWLTTELQERRKAAMDSEPVAWIVHARTGDQLTTDGGYVANAEGILGLHSTPLYRHAQQPVVPDESYQQLSELYHAQEKRLFKIAQRIKGSVFDKYSHSPSQAIDVLEVAIFGEDEACHAAMLQAGNSPVIPDGYVMVPKEPTPEMLEVINEAIKSMRGSAATYARVLAAAPQEVK